MAMLELNDLISINNTQAKKFVIKTCETRDEIRNTIHTPSGLLSSFFLLFPFFLFVLSSGERKRLVGNEMKEGEG